ncbi:hypothetical protein C1645_802674 [Glomus cerebriforme]|uniref:PB1 domain-containing protein n=1 Tax=Glomus cerebriforme TaxID=658196 RepID=A0A397TDJ0_9GLOM|nr:hypothetical protein C1645_802674 [Glomus cerebriforme]
MSTVFKISYKPPPLEVLNQLTQLPPIPLSISPPNLTITRRLIFKSIPSTSFSPTSPTTFSIIITSVKPTWDQLTTKIRSQFNIPANVKFGLTYTKPKDEEIVLSSQKELDNYFSHHKDDELLNSKKNPTYKFELMIFPPKNNVQENMKEGEKKINYSEKTSYKEGQLDVEIYDDDYDEDYDYGYDDEEYVNGCSQQ